MYYVIAFQVLCGFFSAYVADRKGRNGVLWWFVGALVPVFGVALSLALPQAPGPRPLSAGAAGERGERSRRRRPKRCCGSYIPDCHGCPYFRRQLFDPGRSEGKKGRCEFYEKDLVPPPESEASQVSIEDG